AQDWPEHSNCERTQVSSAEARNFQSLPSRTAGMTPSPAKRFAAFGWTSKILAAATALISGSQVTVGPHSFGIRTPRLAVDTGHMNDTFHILEVSLIHSRLLPRALYPAFQRLHWLQPA